MQRVWRFVHQVAEHQTADASTPVAGSALRKQAHRAVEAVQDDIEGLRFNRAVARLYELASAIHAELGADAPDPAALIEAARMLVHALAPMMPHLAEECWSKLTGGREGLVAQAPWPVVDPLLLIEDVITLPVQVNGRKRADITLPRTAGAEEVERAVLSLDAVIRAMEGRPARKVIVVPQRIVNVVA